MVPLTEDTRYVRWAQHNNRRVEVAQFRCIFCGAADLVRRDWNTEHEKDKPTPGRYSPGDGRIVIARPLTRED